MKDRRRTQGKKRKIGKIKGMKDTRRTQGEKRKSGKIEEMKVRREGGKSE